MCAFSIIESSFIITGPSIFELIIFTFFPTLILPIILLLIISQSLLSSILSSTNWLAANKSDGLPVSFHHPVISE